MIKFLAQFIKNPVKTGAIMPSSKILAQAIISTADIENRKVIVEIGPGTGVFTKAIAQQLTSGAVFFAIEFNPDFVRLTKQQCPEVEVYEGDAKDILHYLKQQGVKHCDCIVSSLPWAAFTHKEQKELLQALNQALTTDGVFITFAYVQGLYLASGKRFKSLLNATFSRVEISNIIWRNVPPATIYKAVK
jgi:phospholipid N-methyltransferase